MNRKNSEDIDADILDEASPALGAHLENQGDNFTPRFKVKIELKGLLQDYWR